MFDVPFLRIRKALGQLDFWSVCFTCQTILQCWISLSAHFSISSTCALVKKVYSHVDWCHLTFIPFTLSWVYRMRKIWRYIIWWLQGSTSGLNSKANHRMEIVCIELHCARPTVFYDPRSGFPTAYSPIANGLHDRKLFPLSCMSCCVGMLRFLMLILTTFSPQCSTLGWFKADAYVKKEHFQEIKLKIFLGPLY